MEQTCHEPQFFNAIFGDEGKGADSAEKLLGLRTNYTLAVLQKTLGDEETLKTWECSTVKWQARSGSTYGLTCWRLRG